MHWPWHDWSFRSIASPLQAQVAVLGLVPGTTDDDPYRHLTHIAGGRGVASTAISFEDIEYDIGRTRGGVWGAGCV